MTPLQVLVTISVTMIAPLIYSQDFNCDSSCGCCGQNMTCPSGRGCTADCDEGPNACTNAVFNGNGATSFKGDGGSVFSCGGDCSRTIFNMQSVTGDVEINGCGGGNCHGLILYCGSKTSDCILNCGSNGCNSATIICNGTCSGSSCPTPNAGCAAQTTTTASPITSQPSSSPSMTPTTSQPSLSPSNSPTITDPSSSPTNSPSKSPSSNPTSVPTNVPTSNPTMIPTYNPSIVPTAIPSMQPTFLPTMEPTSEPTMEPTESPTNEPTNPSKSPTIAPSRRPSDGILGVNDEPTISPTVPTLSSTNDYDSTEVDENDPSGMYMRICVDFHDMNHSI